MKKNLNYILFLCLALLACKKNEIPRYETEKDNIRFNYLNSDGGLDSTLITFSFADKPGLASDTVWIPVSVAGKRVSQDRKFSISIVDSSTTAKVDLHYEALKPYYVLPSDSGKTRVPLILKNIDPALANSSVIIGLRVNGGEDFGASLPVNTRSKRFMFSNRLEEPSWWSKWLGNLGPYSRTAHKLYLISGGGALADLSQPNAYMEIPRTLYYLENAKNFTRNPFTWLERNADKGYVLTKRSDGTEDYDFYHKDSPTIKTYVKFFPQVNGYFFINENGNQIIMN